MSRSSPFNCNLPEDLNHHVICFHLADEPIHTRQELEILREIYIYIKEPCTLYAAISVKRKLSVTISFILPIKRLCLELPDLLSFG